MGALVRCDGCGAMRWSLLRQKAEMGSPTCEICGEPLKLERRRPGRRFSSGGRERRDFRAPTESIRRAQ